jgi:lysozyme
MKHITNYQTFNEDIIVKEILDYLNNSINEENRLSSIWNETINKIKGLSEKSKRKVLKLTILSLLTFNTLTNISQLIKSSNTPEDVKQIATEIVEEQKIDPYKAGYDFKLSQEGWDHIKEVEGLRLKAYKIGDGMITVGYGHAESINKSQFNVGQEISKETAEELLKQDLKVAADGVRRMFKEWENQGVKVPITQSMFDALVSIAFNTGVSGMRNSDMADKLKMGNYAEAGDSIKTLRVSKKFPGLKKRRSLESEMFLASL